MPIARDWPATSGYVDRGSDVDYSHSNQHYEPLTVFMRYIAGCAIALTLILSANAEPAVSMGAAWQRAARPLR